jgi:hypothetical protein
MRRRQSTRPLIQYPAVRRRGACPWRLGQRRLKSEKECDCCGGDPTEYSFLCGRCRVVTWCSEFCRESCWDYHCRFCRALGPFPVPPSVRAPEYPPNNCHNCHRLYTGTDRRCLLCNRFLCYTCGNSPESRGLCKTCKFLEGPLYASPFRFPIRPSSVPLPSPVVPGDWVFVPHHSPPVLVISSRFSSRLQTSIVSDFNLATPPPVNTAPASSAPVTAVAAEAADYSTSSSSPTTSYGSCPLCHSDLPDLLARLVLNPNPSTADPQ